MNNLLDYFVVPVEWVYQEPRFIRRGLLLPDHVEKCEDMYEGLPLAGLIGAMPVFDLTTKELADERIAYLEQENAYLRQCLEEANENTVWWKQQF